jgi:hypothetical protein
MKYTLFCLSVLIIFTSTQTLAQKTYPVSVGEFIFSYGTPVFRNEFITANPEASVARSNLRFTFFFHFEQDWHIDLNNYIGFITGVGIRNIGLSTDEILPVIEGEPMLENYKIVRRIYTAGVPLFIKIGSFKDKFFLYAGSEIELALHYKEKYWTGSLSRRGTKTKYSQWLGQQTPLMLPSLAGGIQMPGGINIKFKYYLKDFLNTSYTPNNSSNRYNISDLSRYESAQLYYISLSFQIKSDEMKEKSRPQNTEIAYY